jgi:anti-sigma regulatory factor (Ser/Thr protein kinase)
MGGEQVHQPLWPEGPRPGIDRPLTFSNWPLSSLAELTHLRMRLRDELQAVDAGGPVDGDDVDRLLLAVEELASNSLKYGRPPVTVTLSSFAEGWLIDVTDTAADRPPTPAVDRDPAYGGLGLALVAQLSTAHGWYTEAAACKHVWAFLARVRTER